MTGQADTGLSLEDFLTRHGDKIVARVVLAVAAASVPVAAAIRRQGLSGSAADLGALAAKALQDHCRQAGVRALLAEGQAGPVALDAQGAFLLATDPLDGGSNVDTNIPAGTIFSVLDAPAGAVCEASFLQPGHRQRAAGFVIYGPQTSLLFTTGAGTHLAVLDPDSGRYVVIREGILIPEGATEFAINASNYRHWQPPVRTYVDDCFEGAEGPRGKNFNMHWAGSIVADAYRIFARGGVFLCPADERKDFQRGRLPLIFEANPLGLLVEQANGGATNGVNRILDVEPKSVGERVPLIFGSSDKVQRISRYHTSDEFSVEQSPLFGKRGLLRN